jgi:anti-anti-sigma regulatory factor
MPPYHTIVISFEGVDFIDAQGADQIAELLVLAEPYDAELRLARVKPHVLDLLRRSGVADQLGEDRIYGNVYEACADRIPESKR